MYRLGHCSYISLDIRSLSRQRGGYVRTYYLLIINRAGDSSATASASDGLIVATAESGLWILHNVISKRWGRNALRIAIRRRNTVYTSDDLQF